MAKLKKHQLWWETNLGTNLRGVVIPGPAEWSTWMGNHTQKDRQLMRQRIDGSFQTLLDVGCGGGLLCEPFARLGTKVTGIDASKNNIEVARIHAQKTNLQIQYLNKMPEEMIHKKFDIILCMEVIEHVDNVEFFIERCFKLLSKNGIIFFSTINRNPKSYLFAILGAEYILRWLPIGTHDWKKFIKPQEIINYVSPHQLIHKETKGVTFNPFLNKWNLSKDTSVNYMSYFAKS